MQVLVVGHSYVCDLSEDGSDWFEVGEQKVEIQYFGKRGASYDTFLNNPQLFDDLSQFKPDIVIVILAGNSIRNSVTNKEIYYKATEFYKKLRVIYPLSKIVAAQVELRFYKVGNRWNCPVGNDYHKRRVALNNFLKALKYKDHILMIAGPNRLDNRSLFRRDGVHLTDEGLLKYYSIIKRVVKYIIEIPNVEAAK